MIGWMDEWMHNKWMDEWMVACFVTEWQGGWIVIGHMIQIRSLLHEEDIT